MFYRICLKKNLKKSLINTDFKTLVNEFSRHGEQSLKAAALFLDCVALLPADPQSTDGGFRAANVLITHYI